MCRSVGCRNMNWREVLFIILNALITVIWILLLIVGGLMMRYTNYVATLLATGSDTVNHISEARRQQFELRVLDMGDESEYYRAGQLLIVMAVFVLAAAALGWVFVWAHLRNHNLAPKILLVSMLSLVMLAVVELGIFSETIDWYSKIPSRMKKYYSANPINVNYAGSGGNDVYTLTVNVLNLEYECCGIESWTEFGHVSSLPPSCCRPDIILTGNSSSRQACFNQQHTALLTVFNQEGCLERAEDKVLRHLRVAVVVVVLLLLMQIVQVLIGLLLMKQLLVSTAVAPKPKSTHYSLGIEEEIDEDEDYGARC